MRAFLWCSVAVTIPCVGASAAPMPPVALVASPEDPFAHELSRELTSAGLKVRRFVAPVSKLDVLAPELLRDGIGRGAAFTEDAKGLWLFSVRGAGVAVEIANRIVIDSKDWTARRRTWIEAVEWLRVAPALTPANPESSIAQDVVVEERTVTPPQSVAITEDGPPVPAPPDVSQPSLWSLGAGTAIGTSPSVIEPSARALLIGRIETGPRFALWSRLEWPLLGTLVEEDAGRARLWTFAVGAGFVITLGPPTWALRPFVGAGTGFDVLLVSDDRFVPSRGSGFEQLAVQGSGLAGFRVPLAARLELGCEISVGYGARVGSGEPPGYSVVRARSAFGQGAVSLMFDF